MKNVILSVLFVFEAQLVTAQEVIRVISDETHDIQVNMNADNVKCLFGDYSQSTLKIVIPELKDYTALDHTSGDSGGPCVSAGLCIKGLYDDRLKDLIIASQPTEMIKVRIKKLEIFKPLAEIISFPPPKCYHAYREEITTLVRGIRFSHYKSIPLSVVSFQDCK